MLLILNSIFFCLLMSCSKPATNVLQNNTDTTMTGTTSQNLTWLALGDSYTIGESVNEEERFPAQTIALLKQDNVFIKPPQYIATTGWTTLNLLNGINQQQPKGPFNIVTLLIGVNDQYQFSDTTNYGERFTECLQKAISLSENLQHVFVLSIPDYSVTPFAQSSDTADIRKQIDEFNAINKTVTATYKISYIDITPFTREAKYDASLIAGDGLHPSGKEYAKWAALLAPEIKKVLK